MREIKFRAWDKNEKEMRTVTKLVFDIVGNFIQVAVNWYSYMVPLKHRKRYILMQFTGLKDKNGKEIYDGDICLLDICGDGLKYNPKEALTVIVEKRHGCWGFRHTHPDLVCEEDREWKSFWQSDDKEVWDENYFELIGNVYENPELLTEDKK